MLLHLKIENELGFIMCGLLSDTQPFPADAAYQAAVSRMYVLLYAVLFLSVRRFQAFLSPLLVIASKISAAFIFLSITRG